ncbi:MAG: hypothetical protein ACKVK8_09750 [Rhodospirillales bacterium]
MIRGLRLGSGLVLFAFVAARAISSAHDLPTIKIQKGPKRN